MQFRGREGRGGSGSGSGRSLPGPEEEPGDSPEILAMPFAFL